MLNDLNWTAIWTQGLTDLSIAGETIANQTLRIIVSLTQSGEQFRIRLSNKFGDAPLILGAAHAAVAGEAGNLVSGTGQPITFSGQTAAEIAAGSELASDPITLSLEAGSSISLSLYFPEPTSLKTCNVTTLPIYRGAGNITGQAEAAPGFSLVTEREVTPEIKIPPSIPFLAGLDLLTMGAAGAVVAFGDSITFSGWPAMLEQRLKAAALPLISVLNQGISGNRILYDSAGSYGGAFGPAGIKRFAQDALAQPGVRYILVLEGVNDLTHPGAFAPAEQEVDVQGMIAGLETYVKEAHQRNVKILGGTILPFEGNPLWNSEREATRQAVNEWIRNSGVFDGVFDGDLATRNPDQPTRLLESFDTGDHLHPNPAGLHAIAESIDLAHFKE